jgi:hypothetical protein
MTIAGFAPDEIELVQHHAFHNRPEGRTS